MIQIFIPNNDQKHLPWKHQLEEWCIAHQVMVDDSLNAPELREKEAVYRGEKDVAKFLMAYKDEYDDWNDCRCNKWMDE